jgi:hypothetical protein
MNPGEIGCRISRGRQDYQDIFCLSGGKAKTIILIRMKLPIASG